MQLAVAPSWQQPDEPPLWLRQAEFHAVEERSPSTPGVALVTQCALVPCFGQIVLKQQWCAQMVWEQLARLY